MHPSLPVFTLHQLQDNHFPSHLTLLCKIKDCRGRQISSKGVLKHLENAIRQCARTVLKKEWHEPIKEDIYKTLRWMLPQDFCFYSQMCFVYEFLHLKSHNNYFYNFFNTVQNTHNYETRAKCKLHIPKLQGNDYGKRCISYSASKKWNALPESITQSQSLSTFRKDIKKHIFVSQK